MRPTVTAGIDKFLAVLIVLMVIFVIFVFRFRCDDITVRQYFAIFCYYQTNLIFINHCRIRDINLEHSGIDTIRTRSNRVNLTAAVAAVLQEFLRILERTALYRITQYPVRGQRLTVDRFNDSYFTGWNDGDLGLFPLPENPEFPVNAGHQDSSLQTVFPFACHHRSLR